MLDYSQIQHFDMAYIGVPEVDTVTGIPTQRGKGQSRNDPSGKYLIGFSENFESTGRLPDQAKATEKLNNLGILNFKLYENVGIAVAKLTPKQIADLKSQDGITFVEPNREVTLADAETNSGIDPLAKGGKGGGGGGGGGSVTPEEPPTPVDDFIDWGVKKVWNGKNPNDFTPSGKVAWVIDTGISSQTDDLNLDSRSTGFSQEGQNGLSSEDVDGHGTHVAGTIAAKDNGIGTVGVAPGANVVALRVFFPGEATYDDRVIAAIDYAIANKTSSDTNVINMSLGRAGSIDDDEALPYKQAIQRALKEGFKIALAAGNDSDDADNYSPAGAGDLNGVFTVSAAGRYAPHPKRRGVFVATTDESYDLVMAHFSNYDDGSDTDDVKYAAPGLLITSLGLNNGELVQMSGTSMASPHMAGALLWGTFVDGESIAPFFSSNGGALPDPLVLLG